MKIVEQSVKLVAFTGQLDLLRMESGPQELIEAAGRTCYKSERAIGPDTASPFIRKLINIGHESVLEHSSATFRIVTDRGISHEIVRHRLASYSQESTRYCNYAGERFGKEITVIKPPFHSVQSVSRQYTARNTWKAACEQAEASYFGLLANCVPPEIARSVLPTCLKTEIVMTANFREWRHFLRLRLSPKAHPQMREVAGLIGDELLKIAPDVFDGLMQEKQDGTQETIAPSVDA